MATSFIERTGRKPEKRILIINPNSTPSMTEGLKRLVCDLKSVDTTYEYYTAPSGPSSINNEDDAAESARHCDNVELLARVHASHGVLVACYSKHPLVPLIKSGEQWGCARKPVTGIFEASVATSLQLLGPGETFGIVSTGRAWEAILTDAVAEFLGTSADAPSSKFAGVETTGLNATELHDAPPEEVRRKMMAATRRLLRKAKVGAICLGCAGMAGMDEMVREACVQELGDELGHRVWIVDGVKAGVLWLEGVLRSQI